MARKAVRAAKPLGWMALGGAITATWMLGPRVAVEVVRLGVEGVERPV